MADAQPPNLYGVVGQPLTRDYLARQLPIFQQKVPNSQPKPQFHTNAPPNLPLPPLYPGEVIKLQQHPVVCTDTFDEPAVGAVYISNYRFIFYGNSISDPDSMDALQDNYWKGQAKKDSTETAPSPIPFSKSATNKFKPFSMRPEPSFKSFLMGGRGGGGGGGEGERKHDSGRESPPPHQSTAAAEGSLVASGTSTGSSTLTRVGRHTQRIKSGFKKIGSLRRSPRNQPKHASAHSLPIEFVDKGCKSPEGLLPSPSLADHPQLREEPSNKKRKDIMMNYRQDTVSLDSVSVSSASEFSVAGTDDRSTCSPLGDGETSGPVDILRGERVCLNGMDRELGFSDPISYGCLGSIPLEVSDSSYQTVDSGINVDRPSLPSSVGGDGTGKGASIGTGKGSSEAQTAIREKQVNHQDKQTSQQKESPDVEKEGNLEERSTSEESLCKLPDVIGSRNGTLTANDCSTLGKSNTSSRSTTLEGGAALGMSGSEPGLELPQSGMEPAQGGMECSQIGTEGESSQNGTELPRNEAEPSQSGTEPSETELPQSGTEPSQEVTPELNPDLISTALLSNGLAECVPRQAIVTTSAAESTINGACNDVRNTDLSPLEGVSPTRPCNGDVPAEGDHAHLEGEAVPSHRRVYANVKLISDPGVKASVVINQKVVSRKRSKSSSPYVRKKPKPLPRKSLQTKQSSSEDTRNDIFLSSLPADFKPVPLPRGSPSSGLASSPSKNQGVLELDAPQWNSCSPQKKDLSNSSTPKVPSPSPPKTPTTTPRHEYSPPASTPSHLPPLDTSREVSNRCPPRSISVPSSPLYTSSTSNISSDAESDSGTAIRQDVASEPDPIPPPRRRRRSKTSSASSTKDLVQSVTVLPTSPEEPPNSEDRLPKSRDLTSRSCDQPDGGAVSLPNTETSPAHNSSGSLSSRSRDLDDCSESSKSHDLGNEEDILTSPLLEEVNDVFAPDISTPTQDHLASPALGEGSARCSIGSSVRTSRASLTVFPGSSSDSSVLSGVTLRTYSFVSPGVTSNQFNFPGDSSSGVNTLPRSLMAGSRGQSSNRVSLSTVPASTRYSLCVSFPLRSIHSVRKIASVMLKEHNLKLPEGLLILSRNFQSVRLHIHPHNTYDADGLRELMERKFLVEKPLYELFAFQYRAAIRHPNPTFLHNRSLPNHFSLPAEMSRLGLQDSKLWAVTRVLDNHPELCPSYPKYVIVPTCTGELDYIRAAKQYHEGRFPTLTWYNPANGAALIRAASTHDERGLFSSGMQMDEALLQSISGSKLDPTGPPMIVQLYVDKPESGLNERNAEQARTYYYHSCKFVYSSNTSTYRTVRHSFNKLQAMLENSLSDEDYLIALDTTRWLSRVGELLSTAQSICHSLLSEGAHVLVGFESGWDRTTQLVSLAQLLMDPYYRTMDGFQVLVQKEWVWFGHPFQQRHSRAGKSKEDGPIFLQWVDCVWQVMQQCPSAFEFNEKFLMCLVEHSYSGMFGTFMTNCETERKQYFTEKGLEHMSVSSHTVSFWTWVNMMNASRQMFFNRLYDANVYTGMLQPRSSVPCLKLWTSHYCRCKPQENVYQSSVQQTQLEELVKTKKKLEALYAQLAPAGADAAAAAIPPPLGPRDEIFVSSGDSPPMSREKPVPPPKPVAKTYKYESLTEFLVKEGFDPSICMHLELSANMCQGNLYKLGGVRKNWLQRWFVLDFNCRYFAYFENQQAYSNKESPKGVIRLGDISRVYQDVKKKEHLMKNIFHVETPHRTYLMQAPTILTMYIWIACLELPVTALRLGAT